MTIEPTQRAETRGSTLTSVLSMLVGSKEPPLPSQPAMGFFTDTSLCIGCKACEVACKQWNQLPASDPVWTGSSYDNTGQLSATTWRHVLFIEHIGRPEIPVSTPGTALPFFNTDRWLMQSDVCKHCANAPCQEACPTGSIIRTEFDTVYVQQEICNGCGYCVVACPFGVIARDEHSDHTAHKCTLCYDRLKDGIEPACAKACPTDSILFGPVDELREKARERLQKVRAAGQERAYLYGADDAGDYKRLNAFFLLTEEPAAYNLPTAPHMPTASMKRKYIWSAAVGLALSAVSALILRRGK